MKNWTKIVAGILCVALALAFAGCSLVAVDEDKDKAQVVATVNGEEIHKEEFLAMQQQYIYIYQMFGMDPTSDEATLAEFNSMILDGLVNNLVLEQQAKAQGFDQLTDEEKAEVDAEFKTAYDEYKENFRDQAESEAELDSTIDVETRLDEIAKAQLETDGSSYDEVIQDYYLSKAIEKLQQSVYDSVSLSDDDVKAWYDSTKESQITEIQAEPTAYENYAGGAGTTPALYAPEGYRYVKHILIKFEENEELTAQMDELTAQKTTLETELTTLKEDEAANAAAITEKEGQIAELDAQYAQLETQYKASALAKAQDVLARLQAGEDFATLMAEFNEDTGVAEGGAYAETGYLVGPGTTDYYQSFTDAANALANVGDYSELVETGYGFHILRLESLVTPGEVAFETVKEECRSAATTEKQEAEWAAKQQEWTEASEVVKYEDRLKDLSSEYDK